jgi:hypothetical protein
MLPNSTGEQSYWVDMFYNHLNYDFGIIPKDLFERNMDKFPTFLLHSMLACCYKSSVLPLSVFDPHFQSALKLMNPEKLSIFNCISEVSMALFCYFAGYSSFGIPFFTRAITTANLIGLSQGFTDASCPIDQEDYQILALRTWVCLYSVDYYYRAMWDVPCLMSSEIPPNVMNYFTNYVSKSQLFQEDNLLSFSIYLVPLFNIGKRFYHHLDGNCSVEQMDQVIDELTSELNRWYVTLPPIKPFLEREDVPFSTETFWDTYLLMNYHELFLTIMTHRYARVIDRAPLSHPAIHHCQVHANSFTSLFKGCAKHYQSFERMAGMLARYVFVSGIIHCSLGYRDAQLLQKAVWHLRLLQSSGLAKYQFKNGPLLEKCIQQPFMAIEYLKQVNKVL